MAVRTIQYNEALDSIWGELVYTRARLGAHPLTREFLPPIAALVERWSQVRNGQLGAWAAEVEAQARVDGADDDLDDRVEVIAIDLLRAVNQDRSAARFRRYFTAAPSLLLRLGLASELVKVTTWPASLATEPEAALIAHSAPLAQAITAGTSAIEARAHAAAARTDQRVRDIVVLIDDINATRRSLYGELLRRQVAERLPRNFPERFFRRTHGASHAGVAAGLDTPPIS